MTNRDQGAGAEGIVWIVSYPKSGNTWVRCLIANLMSGVAGVDLDRLADRIPYMVGYDWLEDSLDIDAGELVVSELEAVRASAYRRNACGGRAYIKTHDRYSRRLFPTDFTAGAVYIVRDPRDVAPSFADFMGLSLDFTVVAMANPLATLGCFGAAPTSAMPQRLGRWSDHVASWLDGGLRPLLLLRYEDMLSDLEGQTRRIASFLGLPDDGATIDHAVGACRFDRLRQIESESGFAERPAWVNRFFRQGESGAWRRTLTDGHAARIVADHGPMMTRLGYL